ncbi:unnamed protein product [Dovyalis caffra]|uniref:Uncharacterized protein n=1 Tax=Dovyalis caffra TaxID=77055 RepID=A0AAV1RYR5_9ROSI|nr:unnamed protein product [Dovyalis caffra]
MVENKEGEGQEKEIKAKLKLSWVRFGEREAGHVKVGCFSGGSGWASAMSSTITAMESIQA